MKHLQLLVDEVDFVHELSEIEAGVLGLRLQVALRLDWARHINILERDIGGNNSSQLILKIVYGLYIVYMYMRIYGRKRVKKQGPLKSNILTNWLKRKVR